MRQNRNLNRYFEYCKSIIEEFLQAYEKHGEQKDNTCLQCLHQEVEDNITDKDLLYEFPEELKSKYQLTPTVHVNFEEDSTDINPALKDYVIMVILKNPAQPAIYMERKNIFYPLPPLPSSCSKSSHSFIILLLHLFYKLA